MAKQRVVNTAFWDDRYIITLSPLEKLLFLYLITNPLTNILGIYEISIRRICFDTGLNPERVTAVLKKFESDGKARYKDGFVIMVNSVKHQSLNPNICKGIERELEALPENIKPLIDFERLSYLTKLNLTKLNLTKPNGVEFLSLIPESIKTNEFVSSWQEWLEHRKQIRHKLTEGTARKQLKFLARQSDPIAVIEMSIEKGWQGLFEIKENGNTKQNPKKQPGQNPHADRDIEGRKTY